MSSRILPGLALCAAVALPATASAKATSKARPVTKGVPDRLQPVAATDKFPGGAPHPTGF